MSEESENSTRHDEEGDHARRNDSEEDDETKRNAQDSLRIRVFNQGPEQEKVIARSNLRTRQLNDNDCVKVDMRRSNKLLRVKSEIRQEWPTWP